MKFILYALEVFLILPFVKRAGEMGRGGEVEIRGVPLRYMYSIHEVKYITQFLYKTV